APPRNWMCMAVMVTARRSERVSSRARSMTTPSLGLVSGRRPGPRCRPMPTGARGSGSEDERVDRDGEEQQRQVADRIPVELDRALGRGFLRRATPPQPVGLPDEDRAKTDGRPEVDQ